MNRTETAEVLHRRRNLTGVTYNDDTVDAWQAAFADQDFVTVMAALVAASQVEKRITVAHVFERMATRRAPDPHETAHPESCMCGGHGWVEVELHDDTARHSWWAWDRCPEGPPTGYTQPADRADVISLDGYLARMQRRADNGDVEAGHILKAFKRHPTSPLQMQQPDDIA